MCSGDIFSNSRESGMCRLVHVFKNNIFGPPEVTRIIATLLAGYVYDDRME